MEAIVKVTESGEEYKVYPKPDDFEPDPNFPSDHAFYGSPRCTAWSKRNGRQCLNRAMEGATKCRMHGGKSLAGALSPRFEHGGTSKYLPDNLLEKYESMKGDPELLSLNNEIRYIDVRIAQIFENMEGFTDSTSWIRELQDKVAKYERAKDREDYGEEVRLLSEVKELVERGAEQRDTWNELVGLFEAKKRLANAERDRIKDLKAMLTAEEALVFVTALSQSLKDVLEKHIEDEELRREIRTDVSHVIRKLTNRHTRDE